MDANELKICSKCNCAKNTQTDFYVCKGIRRSECKACTIQKNIRYQRRVKAWQHRFVDNDEQRSYMAEYYAKNKDKFAEYRRRHKERCPDYHKEWARQHKHKRKRKKTEEDLIPQPKNPF